MLKKVTWTNLAQADVSSFFCFSLASILLSNHAESYAIPKTCFFFFPKRSTFNISLPSRHGCLFILQNSIPRRPLQARHPSVWYRRPACFIPLCSPFSEPFVTLYFDCCTSPSPTLDSVLHVGLPPGGVKNPPANAGDRRDVGSIPGLERSFGGGHGNPIRWRIPWTEEPGGVQSMGSQGVGHNWSNLACTHAWWWWVGECRKPCPISTSILRI